jgi:5,10-methylenetetrahydromethanopterin reductase
MRPTRLDGVGVTCQIKHPTFGEFAEFARVAEEAGADWCSVSDFFGWRDTWMLLGAAAGATRRILLGPGVTNPYTRHPFQTVSALASLDELTGGRALLGVGAGGSELRDWASIDRSDSPQKLRELVQLVRRAGAGESPFPLVPKLSRAVPILGGVAWSKLLRAVGECCDMALLKGFPHTELDLAARLAADGGAALAWTPTRASDGSNISGTVLYGILNSPPAVRRKLDVDLELETTLREATAKSFLDAVKLVPDRLTDAFTVSDDVDEAAATASRIGAQCIIATGFNSKDLPDRIAWARSVLDRATRLQASTVSAARSEAARTL